ncbi:MAG: Scr1 family TA system antitoxin-like transcriptional regulator [Streptosporangiaceae bacterium]
MRANDLPDPKVSMWAWMGVHLRFMREQKGMSQSAVAKLLTCGIASISRIENNQEHLDEKEAMILDEVWRTGDLFLTMHWYASKGHDPNWHSQHLSIEAVALAIRTFQGLTIPGLLQIPEYARALALSMGSPNIDAMVEERMARRVVLLRDPSPVMWAIVPEHVLDTPVGGPEVMRKQLAYLLEITENPNVGLRVIARRSGAHAGVDGSFKVMTMPGGDVAYTESPGGGRLVPSASEVRGLLLRYDRISNRALDEDQSRVLVGEIMEAMT